MPLLEIGKIKVGERARVDLGDTFEALKTSIEKRGQMHPIAIEKETNILIAGFRRYTAMSELGFEKVEVKFYENLKPEELLLLELEENIQEPLKWNEKAKLNSQIHTLKSKIKGKSTPGHTTDGQTLQNTADELGINISTLSRDISLTEAMEEFPQLENILTRNQALKAVDRISELALLSEIARRSSEYTFKTSPYLIFNEDCVEGIKTRVDDDTIDLIICDPPWGIDIDERGKRTSGGDKAQYDDSWGAFSHLIINLIPELQRVLKEDGHMYYFFGISDLEAHFLLLSEGLFENPDYIEGKSKVKDKYIKVMEKPFFVDPVPCIWVKEGGSFTDWDHRHMPRYEAFFFCSMGTKKLFNDVTSNIFEYNRTLPIKRVHPQEKPIELIQRLIKLSTQPNEIILDPCAGSFVTSVAATLSNRKSISFENVDDYFVKGSDRLMGVISGDEETDAEENNTGSKSETGENEKGSEPDDAGNSGSQEG